MNSVFGDGEGASMQEDSDAAREPSCALAQRRGLGHSIAMKAAARETQSSSLIVLPAVRGNTPRPATFVKLAELRKRSECGQVAAVCYRVRGGEVEFLLVRTRGSGRWTFPKGSAEPGITQAQAAALEAFEEAGVHGRMEEPAFASYRSRPGESAKQVAVSAHLCEVSRLCAPKEMNRNRTWFSAVEAKEKLREGRKRADGAEMARVIDTAVRRIERVFTSPTYDVRTESDAASGLPGNDPLRRVYFEASALTSTPSAQSWRAGYAGREPQHTAQHAATNIVQPAWMLSASDQRLSLPRPALAMTSGLKLLPALKKPNCRK